MKGTKAKVLFSAVAVLLLGAATGCSQGHHGNLSRIHFDLDRYDIKAEFQDELASNAAWMQSHPNSNLVVEGHCDERGSTEYNIALGDRRAKAAKAYLQHLGVNGARTSTISYGEERPLCNEHNEGCWWKNRRAEFLSK